jgi:ketosteroid isomerase-like protein
VNDKETIERQREEFVAAFNREDVEAMARYASDDTIGMAPSRAAIRGLEAHRVFWSAGFAAAKSLFYMFPEELEVAGNTAVDRHRWVLDSMPRRGGRPVHDEGNGIWIWRRQKDGAWKVARAIWNSDVAHAALLSGSNSQVSEDLAGINQLIDRFVATVNAGDLAGWADLLTDDFIFMVPDAPKFVGKEMAVGAAKMAFFDPFVLKLANKYEDVQIFGSQAFAQGIFTLDRIPKGGGGTIAQPGKFLNYLRKQPDGSWKYTLVSFSYDAPTA